MDPTVGSSGPTKPMKNELGDWHPSSELDLLVKVVHYFECDWFGPLDTPARVDLRSGQMDDETLARPSALSLDPGADV